MLTGTLPLLQMAPGLSISWEEYTGEDFDKNFQIVLNPVQNGIQSYSWNHNHALAICSQTQHAFHAASFIDTLTNDSEVSNEYYSQVGHLPSNKQYLTDPRYTSAFYQAYMQQLTHATCIHAQNVLFGKAMDFCVDTVKRILFEHIDIQKELEGKRGII